MFGAENYLFLTEIHLVNPILYLTKYKLSSPVIFQYDIMFLKLSTTIIHLCVWPPAAAKLLQLCPTLCDPIDGSPPGSPVPGILQARTGVDCHFLQCMKVKSESEVAIPPNTFFIWPRFFCKHDPSADCLSFV